ncbi:MAG: OmpA family protein [Flavobacteriales bacterium]
MTYFKTLFVLLAFAFIAQISYAQDEEETEEEEKEETSQFEMIENGGFELAETGEMKKFHWLELADGWRSCTYIKADLFSEGAKGAGQSIPKNEYGTQATIDGSNYAGFRAYSKDPKKERTYIGRNLIKQMEKNKSYCIKINVSLADLSRYAVNNIGIHVSKNRVQTGNDNSIIKPDFQIRQLLNPVITEREGWATICGTYVANGGEGAIIIGCFAEDDDLKIEKMTKPKGETRTQILDSYYYLENVEVNEVENSGMCICGDEEIKEVVIYSPPFMNFDELTNDEKITNSTVYFGQETANISAVAERDLKRFAEFLKANSDINLKLVGHMDLVEFDESKTKSRLTDIGARRAENIITFFVEKGIDRDRFTVQDKAASTPLSKYKTPMQLAKNRRVEFVKQ